MGHYILQKLNKVQVEVDHMRKASECRDSRERLTSYGIGSTMVLTFTRDQWTGNMINECLQRKMSEQNGIDEGICTHPFH